MPVMLHKKRDYVRFEDIGTQGVMTPISVMRRFQEATNEHAVLMDVTNPQLEARCGGRWIIAKMRMEFDRHPGEGEEYQVSTWPLSPGGFKFIRCFLLRDGKGATAVRCVSEWCVLNIRTGELVRIRDDFYPRNAEHLTEKPQVQRYKAAAYEPAEADFSYERVIRPSDLDHNGHTNNLHYINMATDCFPSSALPDGGVKAMEIHFLRQSFEGDRIRIYCREAQPGLFQIQGLCEGNPVFRSVIEL